MDVRRYLDLYVAETEEHVRLLHGSLLGIETRGHGGERGAGQSVHEAFRAAHTLKSLSSAMGHDAVAALAHRLEDRLAAVRDGRLAVDAALVDELLADADAIQAGIASAVEQTTSASSRHPAGAEAPGAAPVSPAGAAATAPDRPAGAAGGAARVVRVRLREDAPLKPVRAMLVMRALEGTRGIIGTDPSEFGEGFGGEFRIFFADDADVDAAHAAILSAGEIDSAEVVDAAAARAETTPPAAVASARQLRVDAARVDSLAEGIGELTVLFGRLDPDTVRAAGLSEAVDRMAVVLAEVQHDAMQLRMVPVRHAFERLPRVVRDAARALGRDVELVIAGDDVELDRAILDEVTEPLVHLLRNAVDHGVEPPAERRERGKPERGRIEVRAERERASVRIVVSDDGRGVQTSSIVERARGAGLLAGTNAPVVDGEELLRLLSHPGLSTAAQVSTVSGRGVGMDVVVSRIRALGGAIEMQTAEGAGTAFGIRLPISLAQTQALRVRVAGEDYAIPLTHIAEAVELEDDAARAVHVRGSNVPLVRLRELLCCGEVAAQPTGQQAAVVAGTAARRAALAVDELVGREQILVRSFDAAAGMLPYFSGATLLADGRPALVLDPLSVI